MGTLRIDNVQFKPSWKKAKRMLITLKESKTDTFNEGVEVEYMSDKRQPLCAMRRIKRMLQKRGINSEKEKAKRGNEFLFKMGNNRPLSYWKCVSEFKKAAKKAGLKGNYTGICWRKGGNQTLMEQGVPEPLRMSKGRWKSRAVRCYGNVQSKEMRKIITNMMNPRPSQETKLRMELINVLKRTR